MISSFVYSSAVNTQVSELVPKYFFNKVVQ
jgi:hypothetical protein